ncbi:MAG: hypothetical protein ACR2RF_05395 [Geminicoccaceae bacterium]
MTRRELAQHVRTTGNGFLEPIQDGTDLTQREITLLQALCNSAAAMAGQIEAKMLQRGTDT